ncbi:MAG: hypothetical protein RLZZ175_2619 [Bacteroidota bacterium]|jgi:hypothetical protein
MKNLLFIFLLCCLNETLFAQIQPINEEFATRESYFYSGKVKTVTENEIDAKTQKSKFKYKLQFNKQGYLIENIYWNSNKDLDEKYIFIKFDSLDRPTLIKRTLIDKIDKVNNKIYHKTDSLLIYYDKINNNRIEKSFFKNIVEYTDTFEINSNKKISLKNKFFNNVSNLDSLLKLYPNSTIENIIKKGNAEYYYSKYESFKSFELKEKKVYNSKNQLLYIVGKDSGVVTYYDTLERITLFKFIDDEKDTADIDSGFINKYRKNIYSSKGKIEIYHRTGIMTSRIDTLWYNTKNKLINLKSVDCKPHFGALVYLHKGELSIQYHTQEIYDVFFDNYNGHNYDQKIIITQTFDYDSKGNWIISKLYADKKLVKIYKREISYWE